MLVPLKSNRAPILSVGAILYNSLRWTAGGPRIHCSPRRFTVNIALVEGGSPRGLSSMRRAGRDVLYWCALSGIARR